jgi:two-component system cell cycle sensor histidine kinase/response regulator CckA
LCQRTRCSVDAPPEAPDASIVIAVSDTGTGIDARTKPRIFEPFFTTKERGAGFGIGLSTVRDIVRAHGGHVGVESELGRGTTFLVYLPPAQSIPRRVSRSERALRRPSVRMGRRVLIVDDEAVVRRSVRRVLQQAGYSAVEAASGSAALELLSKQADQFDVVLLDVDMPGMDGPRTLSALRERRPELRGLFMTGHAAGARIGTTPCLRKPCSAEEIVAAVSRAYETAPEDDEWTEVTSCQ